MRTLVTVMAHKEAQPVFDRHFPHWFDLGGDILVVFPKQSRILLPTIKGKHEQQIMQLEVGKAAHTGVESIIRFRTILEQMAGMGYDRYAFFEYDAICLGPLPERVGDIAGNVFRDIGPNRSFVGTMYTHPPLMFTHKGLEMVVREMQGMGLAEEGAVWDRWFGLCVERIGWPIYDFMSNGIGTARNTWHDAELDTLKAEVRSGRRLVHGIKSEQALKVCVEAYRLWENKQELLREGMIETIKAEGV
jgi:hypothetical protein